MGAVDLHARPSAQYGQKLAASRSALAELAAAHPRRPGDSGPRVLQASSLGAEDMVVTHLLESLRLDVGIFVLQTGMLHRETLQLLDQLKASSTLPVEIFCPDNAAVVQFVSREGKDAMFRSVALRKACCGIRKLEPLERALADKAAWITGLRREQSGARADVPLLDAGDSRRLKLNPLADWTWGDVWHYIAEYQVPYNALHDQFYPSIGCEPCTRAISLGEDFRAGRWWWEDESAKECGLHAKNESALEESTP